MCLCRCVSVWLWPGPGTAVLVASSTRDVEFAHHAVPGFTFAGLFAVHACLPHWCPCTTQGELGELGLGVDGSVGPQFIKPEHLSTVISASGGDFLIVIGDRNMKNDTCQVRGRPDACPLSYGALLCKCACVFVSSPTRTALV
jgi:hypothetical protein